MENWLLGLTVWYGFVEFAVDLFLSLNSMYCFKSFTFVGLYHCYFYNAVPKLNYEFGGIFLCNLRFILWKKTPMIAPLGVQLLVTGMYPQRGTICTSLRFIVVP